jgi:ParB family chromosome partitioning protein
MARRSGLGKGLSALIPSDLLEDDNTVYREVSIGAIRPNTYQPRTYFDEEAMSALASSIREVGILLPLLVRPIEGEEEAYELIAGERRWRAARRAGLQSVPVLIRAETDDVDSLEQALIENIHRSDLNALEEAAAYQRFIDDFDYTHEQVATRVGKSRAVITNTLRLLQLPTLVQQALTEGTISAGHARALLASPDRSFQESMVKRIVSEGLTVRAVEEAVKSASETEVEVAAPTPAKSGTTTGAKNPVAPGRKPLPEPGLIELEELLSDFLNTRVKVELQNRRGRITIDFATLDDLERIYRAMTEPGFTG